MGRIMNRNCKRTREKFVCIQMLGKSNKKYDIQISDTHCLRFKCLRKLKATRVDVHFK